MEGYLQCKIGYQTHKYYFILHDQVLMYCRKQGTCILGQIHMKISKLQLREFSILISTGIDKLQLLFDSNQQRNQWYEFMNYDQTLLSIEDELAKAKSLYAQYDEELKSFIRTVELNPGLSEMAEKLDRYGNKMLDDISQLTDMLMQINNQSEFQSCESIDEEFTQSLQPAPIYDSVRMPNITYNIWADLKHQVNEQIYDMNIPIHIHKPVTLLQVVGSQMQYAHLLDQANSIKDYDLKLAFVAGFIVSSYANIDIKMPFLGLVHETYESLDVHYKYVSEQITKNTICFYAASVNYEFNGSITINSYFEDLCLNITIERQYIIVLKKGKETIIVKLQNHKVCIRNLMTQSPSLSLHGTIVLENPQSKGELTFNADSNQINGQVGKLKIMGNLEKLIAINKYQEEFLVFLKSNNQFDNDKHSQLLPPSDSRFRKDMILMRQGNFYEADKMKKLLREQSQFYQSWFRLEDGKYCYSGGYFNISKQMR